MVTEVLVWAMILSNYNNRVVTIYNSELLCRQDVKEARKALPEAREAGLKCVPRYSVDRPGWEYVGRP